MRVALLFGFLGSGKTTLARRLIDEWGRDQRTAVIVNEFGEVGIDGDILRSSNVDMIELSSGCLCCTLKGSLVGAIEELRAKNTVEQLVIEASGVAQPIEVTDMLRACAPKVGLELGAVLTVVDAAKFNKLEKMLGEFYLAQIASANVVILNKIDLATAQEVEDAGRNVRALNRDARIFFTEHCDIDLGLLMGDARSAPVARLRAGKFDGSHLHDIRASNSNHRSDRIAHANFAVESFVLDGGGIFDDANLRSFFQSLPENVWRAKGFAVTEAGPVLIQYSAGQLDISAAEARNSHHLVLIGRNMDCAAIEKAFKGLARRGPECTVAESRRAGSR